MNSALAFLDRHRYAAAAALYLFFAAVFVHDWDHFVFRVATEQFLQGTNPYTAAQDPEWYMFLGVEHTEPQWYAYPPLPLLLMAITYAPAYFLDAPVWLGRILIQLPVVIAGLGLAHVAGRWAEHLGRADLRRKVEHAFLWNPFLIVIGPVWGMTDPMMMAFLLAAVLRFEQGHPAQAGVLFALSALVKPFPILLAIPLLAYALHHHRREETVRFTGAAAVTGLGIALPFAFTAGEGFWRQVAGMHLSRPLQGHTIWQTPLFEGWSMMAVTIVSWGLILGGLAAITVFLAGRSSKDHPIMLLLLGSLAILAWNRIVNPQYLIMVVVPLLLLARTEILAPFQRRWTTGLAAAYAVMVFFEGYHFLTFIPPDIAMPLFGRPVDEVAHLVRSYIPDGPGVASDWRIAFVPATILITGYLALRTTSIQRPGWLFQWRPHPRATGPSCVALLVVAAGALGTSTAAPAAGPADVEFDAAFDEPRVGAFYYLWWHNPSHDPEALYGNWLRVSQHPEMGYYTNTRAVAAVHAGQMVQSGIDTAVVSFHRGEDIRYEVFQDEAEKAGLWVMPLIELNQIYDRVERSGDKPHRPIDESNGPVDRAAYRLSPDTQDAIVAFVLDLQEQLQRPSAARLDGKPAVMFYDSYVSSPSFHIEDKLRLAQHLLDTRGIDALRDAFDDPDLQPNAQAVFAHHPVLMQQFFEQGKYSLWREAHLEQHLIFWQEVRDRLEAELGPLFLVSGDSFNERAGFEAGTVKSIASLDVFNGSFIYSPSFTWGNYKDGSFRENFLRWEDRNLWLQAFTAGAADFSAFGIAPQYDDTVNRPDGFIIPDHTDAGSTYDLSWESAVARPPSMVLVSTWNEWFEGSSIEPDTTHGRAWMDTTAAMRPRLTESQAAERPDALVVMHEWSSRTYPGASEMALPHDWGLRLVATASRALPDHDILAIDALRSDVPASTPEIVLIDGGLIEYGVDDALLDALDAWRQAGIPIVVVGPAMADPLHALRPECAADVHGPPGVDRFLPGDQLVTHGDGVTHVRGGEFTSLVERCGSTLYVGIKPWGLDRATDADCFAWILDQVGAAETAQPAACAIASSEPFEETQRSLVPRDGVGAPGAP